MRKLLAPIALTAVISGGAGALILGPSLAGAQSDTTTTATATPAPDAAEAARPKPFADALQKLVADGTLTQAQADKVAAALEAARPFGDGPGGRGGPGLRKVVGVALDEAAKALGISQADLEAQLKSGKTLAEIAGDKKGAMIDALVAAATTRIDAAVAAGKLPADQAATIKSNLKDRITKMVEHAGPPMGFGRGGHGPDGDADDAPAPATGTGTST